MGTPIFMLMNDFCPICSPPESCPGYPHLWKRLREEPDRWRIVHDQMLRNNVHREYPPFLDQATSAIQAAVDYVSSGFAKAVGSEKQKRLAICHSCDSYDSSQHRCYLCGCLVNLKASLETQHCPVNKW